jgi:muconolactone D-isomerase
MEFLVRIQTNLPPDVSSERRAELLAAEAARGAELHAQGVLRRIWRIPGRLANLSLYEVADATELHEVLSSLPLWSWMEIDVQPLAQHPLDVIPLAETGD